MDTTGRAPDAYMSYEEFGRRFFEVAVTEERVGDAIGQIAGEAFEMGPIAQGPGKLAKVTAKVRIMPPRVNRRVADEITFAIRIPLEIDMVSTCGSTNRSSWCSVRSRCARWPGPPNRCCSSSTSRSRGPPTSRSM